MPPEEWELKRKWTVYLVVCGFLVGLTLCLIPHFEDHHHGSGVPSPLSHTAQACGTSVVPCESQSGSQNLLLTSFLTPHQKNFYEGVSLRPPFPPPRG